MGIYPTGERKVITMKYRFEWNGNPDYVTLHVGVKLIEGNFVSRDGVCSGTDDEHTLMALMKGVPGVIEVNLRPYSITLKRALVFDRDEVLMAALEPLRLWLEMQGKIEPGEKFEQGKTIREDIQMILCPECKRLQDEEIARCWREIDSLE